MNTYKFTLRYDNTGDARDAAKTLSAYLAQQGSPNAAKSVRYNGPSVVLEMAGNVSALHFAHVLNEINAVYEVEPLNGSEPLLVPKLVTSTHVLYQKA